MCATADARTASERRRVQNSTPPDSHDRCRVTITCCRQRCSAGHRSALRRPKQPPTELFGQHSLVHAVPHSPHPTLKPLTAHSPPCCCQSHLMSPARNSQLRSLPLTRITPEHAAALSLRAWHRSRRLELVVLLVGQSDLGRSQDLSLGSLLRGEVNRYLRRRERWRFHERQATLTAAESKQISGR
jgi:hypothetical protein